MTNLGKIIDALHRSGWTIGDVAFVGRAAERVWVVIGSNGENRIALWAYLNSRRGGGR